MVKTLLLA